MRSRSTSTVSRYSSSVGPSYQGVLSLASTTLSPASADTGMHWMSGSSIWRATVAYSRSISRKRSSANSTRSILLTASTTWRMPSSATSHECRRVWVSTPLRASSRITAQSAVDAPVTMLRVYCSCPGVSATMKWRRAVEK